jgi:hypothetical protein
MDYPYVLNRNTGAPSRLASDDATIWTCLRRRKFPRDINLGGLYSQAVSEFTDCRATLSAANTLAVLGNVVCPTDKFGRRNW